MRLARSAAVAIPVVAMCLVMASLLRHTGAQAAPPELVITYGPNGLQRLAVNGTVLEDLERYPSDAFHIWHMKMTDSGGKPITTGDYGWGENKQSRRWDAESYTWTYDFRWGTIAVQYLQHGSDLDFKVTEKNNSDSGVTLDGAVIYPLALHLPRVPNGFKDAAAGEISENVSGPEVTVAEFGTGAVALVAPSAARPVYSGFLPSAEAAAYTPLVASTAPDGFATFRPHVDRPVAPGESDSFVVSLRFLRPKTPLSSLAADAYKDWGAVWPRRLQWNDHRPIGTVYLASSPQGDPTHAGGLPENPRRYFRQVIPDLTDVTTEQGLAAFQAKILKQAALNVTNLQRLGAQGSITWDIEGEQYPQSTSYVCAPDQIASIAPEMETTVRDGSSPYAGMKLDDAYFKVMRDAGFRIGVCVRPQHFTVHADGTAEQVSLPSGEVAGELIRKMRYAHDRWGATLFYVDSTVEANGGLLDAAILAQAAASVPDSLLIPEESTAKYFAYTAPFQSFLFHRDTGTEASVRLLYPEAFSVNLINDADAESLALARKALTDAVGHGDILMVHADYWQANNSTVMEIYEDAARALSSRKAH